MSIRLRKQKITGTIFDIRSTTPGPGEYTIQDDKEIGKTRSRLLEWRSKERKTDWYVKRHAAIADTPLTLDHHCISSLILTTPVRLKTTMSSSVPRSPVYADSRRPKEKMNYAVFQIAQSKSTSPALGPGKYSILTEKDFGHTKSNLLTWTSPNRSTNWWMRQSDAPADMVDLALRPSRSRIGGRDSTLWPLPEDDQGVPLTDNPYEYIRAQSRAASRSATPDLHRKLQSGGQQRARPTSAR